MSLSDDFTNMHTNIVTYLQYENHRRRTVQNARRVLLAINVNLCCHAFPEYLNIINSSVTSSSDTQIKYFYPFVVPYYNSGFSPINFLSTDSVQVINCKFINPNYVFH